MNNALDQTRGASRWRTGFSLIELMVTIAVLSIIAAIAAPNMADMIDKRRAVGAAEEVSSLLHLARSEAIKQSRSIRVTILDTKAGTWMVGLSQGAANCKDDCQISEGGTMVTRMTDASRYPGVTLQSDVTSVTFDPRGLLSSTEAELGFTSERTWRASIQISPLGRILICSPSGAKNAGGYKPCPADPEPEPEPES